MAQRNHVLDEVWDPHGKGQFWSFVRPSEKHWESVLRRFTQQKIKTASAELRQPTAVIQTGWCRSFVRSFVRLFVLCGQGSSLLWTPALRPYSGPVLLPRERKRIGRCVRCVLATCVEGRSSTSEQLVGYFYRAPFLDVAVWLSPDWRCILRQPAASQIYLLWLTQARQADLTHFPLWKIRRLRCGLSSTLFWPLVIIVICCNTNKLSK